jgi:Ca-activated chloride channel family protein
MTSAFANINYLWLAFIVPLVIVAFAFDGQRRRRTMAAIGHLPMIQRITASASSARRRWKALLMVVGIALLVLALAQPRRTGATRVGGPRGIDLVLCVDLSKSMLAADVTPTRIDRVKLELGALLSELKNDRVGAVLFAGEYMTYPLTTDYEAVHHFWATLGPNDMPLGGSDIGLALDAAGTLLAEAKKGEVERRPRHLPAQVVVLISDGGDTGDHAREAGKKLAEAGVRVMTVGVGSKEAPYVQLVDENGEKRTLTDAEHNDLRPALDEELLRGLASDTGGDYFPFESGRGFAGVLSALAPLQRAEEKARYEYDYDDVGRWALAPALLLLVAGGLLRDRRRLVSTVMLIVFFPYLTAFDFFKRRDPDVEEGNRQMAAGKAAEALTAYDRAAAARPDDPVVQLDRGNALLALGQPAEAEKALRRAAEARDTDVRADAFYDLGNALFEQKKLKDAVDAYRRTLALRSDDRRAKWNLELAQRRLREEPPPPPQGGGESDKQEEGDKNKQEQPKPQSGQQDDKKQQPQAKAEEGKDKDKQPKPQPKNQQNPSLDALDALERFEPTVQKELAKRRAIARGVRKVKDY